MRRLSSARLSLPPTTTLYRRGFRALVALTFSLLMLPFQAVPCEQQMEPCQSLLLGPQKLSLVSETCSRTCLRSYTLSPADLVQAARSRW
ncbi:hypothetical protein BDW69DRAFT_173498 [Aspergillus filifer]